MKKITRNLGGERLGSGAKMNVSMHGFGRSSHNLNSVVKTSQAAGTLVPVQKYICMNGGDFYIELDAKIRTLPTNGPIFGVFKHQIDVFQIPMRLYNAQLHNNELYIGLDMSKVKFPQVKYRVQKVPAGTGNKYQVASDSLTAYLGIRGFGTKDPEAGTAIVHRKFNAMFELAYWEIYKEYYANKQEEIGYVISGGGLEISENETENVKEIGIFEKGSTQIGPNNGETLNEQNNWTTTKDLSLTYTDSGNYGVIRLYPKEGKSINDIRNVIINIEGGTIQEGKTMAEWANTLNWAYNENQQNNYIAINSRAIGDTLTVKKNIKWLIGGVKEAQIKLEKFELKNIDKMRRAILSAPYEEHFDITTIPMLPYNATYGSVTTNNPEERTGNNCFFTQSGLGIKTYQSDRFNNWLSTEWIDGENGINEITAVQVVDGKITMNALLLQEKLYNMMNRIAISGGSFDDWQEVQYGERVVRKAESPIYEGGMSSEIYFDEVVSTADAGENDPLGSLAGRGSNDSSKRGANKMIHIHVMEPSIIMVIESITPRITYSQGIDWETQLETMDDLHVPSLDGIGFQDLITEEMAAFDSIVHADGTVTKFSAGKQPSWIQYQTNVDKTFGDFAAGETLEWMSLNRDYEQDETTGRIKDLTTYIDPTKSNIAFADAKLTAKNFWVQVAIKCTARRKMSANQIPVM